MKVLHVVGGKLTQGAHKGAFSLHKGLVSLGIDSVLVTSDNTGFEEDRTVLRSQKRLKISGAVDRLALSLYHGRSASVFNSGLFNGGLSSFLLLNAYDIINLHWITYGPISFRELKRITIPIVITLRDMWPLTGGCCYSLECKRYISGCGKCPQLGSNSYNDISRLYLYLKKICLPTNITCVGISEWMTQCSASSYIFSKYPTYTIHNSIDTITFKPTDSKKAKQNFGIPNNKKVVLVGATSLDNPVKGFDLFLKSLTYLDPESYFLLFFGNLSCSSLDNIPFQYLSLGYIEDDNFLSSVYSASDVFVAPSRYEAFGKTIIESMACGTPVVAFDATGPKDIIKHHISGYKAQPYDERDLAKGIEWVCNNSMHSMLRHNAREEASKRFSQEVVARQYGDLYSSILFS